MPREVCSEKWSWYTRGMRAWQVHEYGRYAEVLELEDCADPAAPDDGVVIKVNASGVNFPDMLAIAGKYQVRAPLPFSPGLEAAGVVEQVGPDSELAVGDRVLMMGPWGAHAERMAAPDAACFALPDSITDEHAAAMHVIYQTSYFALTHRAQLQPGETLLVHGAAGGVGTSAVQLGKALGATVIATAGGERKLQVCRDAGADHVIDYRQDDFVPAVKQLTSGRGADVIYDPVGGDVFDHSVKCLAFSGRLLVIGFASGRIPEISANRILLRNISVIGLHWGAYAQFDPQPIRDAHDVLMSMHAQGKLAPVIYAAMPLADYPQALDAMRNRQSYGKIVLSAAADA